MMAVSVLCTLYIAMDQMIPNRLEGTAQTAVTTESLTASRLRNAGKVEPPGRD